MICVVTLNPALDITHDVVAADWSGVNRPTTVRARPGGKGLNVARILHALGTDVLATGLLGGLTGEAVRSGLAEAGVPARFAPVSGETRRTFTVMDASRDQAAVFNEPGPAVSTAEYGQFCVLYEKALAGCAAVVLSGSLPPGVAWESYADLTRLAAAAGVPAVIDTDGPALVLGAGAGPAIVKPNLAELERCSGRRLGAALDPDLDAVRQAAGELRAAGAGAVVVSLGPRGLLAVTGAGTWHAAPAAPVAGNPTGAGDAVAAGLARGLALGSSWGERLAQATALGAAAVAAPAAGELDLDRYRRELAGVRVSRIEESPCPSPR